MTEELSEWKDASRVALWSVVVMGVMGCLSLVAPLFSLWDGIDTLVDNSSFTASDDALKVSTIIVFVVRFLMLFGYAGYVWALTRFTGAQADWRDERPVRQVRSGVLLLSVSVVMGLAVALLEGISLDMFVVIVCGWVFDIVALTVMKDGFRQMCFSERYAEQTRRGAHNLQSAASYNITLLLVPIFVFAFVTFFALIIYSIGLTPSTHTVTHISSSGHVEHYVEQIGSLEQNLESATKSIMAIAGSAAIIGFLMAVVFQVLAVVFPILGWNRIMNGGIEVQPEEKQNVDQASVENATAEVTPIIAETEVTDNVDEASDKTPSALSQWLKDRRVWLGVAGVLAVAAVVFGLVSLLGGGRNNPLGIEHPTWKRFVVIDSGTLLHKEPSAQSATLQTAFENIESDAMACEYRWSDQGRKRGYTTSDYVVSDDSVFPVEAEENGWLKVLVSNDWFGSITAYVEQDVCRDVKPAKLKPDVFDQIDNQGFLRHYIVGSGSLRDLCLKSEFDDMDGEELEMGQLFDDCLVFPWANCYIACSKDESTQGIQLDGQEKYYRLTYGEQYAYKPAAEEAYADLLDTRKLAADLVERLYELMKNDNPQYFTAYYYFPDVAKEHFFSFSYSTQQNSNAVTGDTDEETPTVTGYRSVSDGDEYYLQAEYYGEAYDDTGIHSYYSIDVLQTADLDGDGHMEAIVEVYSGGNAAEPVPFIVYYDQQADAFKTTDEFNNWHDVIIEERDGRTMMVQQEGIKVERYVFEDHELKNVETDVYDVGRTLRAWKREELFPVQDESSENQCVRFDLDGDGADEELWFCHDTYHAFQWGAYMLLYNIVWADGHTTDAPGAFTSDSFAILESVCNGVHDLLLGDTFLLRWNGSHYEQWTWDGTELQPLATDE